jgi:hypothetical protein
LSCADMAQPPTPESTPVIIAIVKHSFAAHR